MSYNLLDFRVGEKICQNSICSLSPGDHDEYGRLDFQFVIVQKLLAENILNKLANTDHMRTMKCTINTNNELLYLDTWYQVPGIWYQVHITYIPLPCSFSFVFSFRLVVFRLFLVSPSSLFFSLPCFPWLRILLFCYFVSGATPPPRSLQA